MAKPIGIIGPTQVTVAAPVKVEVAFQQIEFPKNKDEIEALIVHDFLSSMNKALASEGEAFIFTEPTKNAENDFDFSVKTSVGPAFLELMEIAPLELFGGGYDKVPPKYKPYELAKVVVQKIMKKAVRYSGNVGRPLFLLTYITHWGFTPSESLVALIRFFLREEKHPFNAVFLYSPIERGFGDARWLYPVPPELLSGVDPEKLRDNEVINLDPQKWQISTSTGRSATTPGVGES